MEVIGFQMEVEITQVLQVLPSQRGDAMRGGLGQGCSEGCSVHLNAGDFVSEGPRPPRCPVPLWQSPSSHSGGWGVGGWPSHPVALSQCRPLVRGVHSTPRSNRDRSQNSPFEKIELVLINQLFRKCTTKYIFERLLWTMEGKCFVVEKLISKKLLPT